MYLNIYKQNLYTLESLDRDYVKVVLSNAPINILVRVMQSHVDSEVGEEPVIPTEPDFIIPEEDASIINGKLGLKPFKPSGQFDAMIFRRDVRKLGYTFEYLALATVKDNIKRLRGTSMSITNAEGKLDKGRIKNIKGESDGLSSAEGVLNLV